jgi:hypothetical protein
MLLAAEELRHLRSGNRELPVKSKLMTELMQDYKMISHTPDS